MTGKHVLVACGTRPEAIKLAPVLDALREGGHAVSFVVTGQHRELLDPILRFFQLKPDVSLTAMRHGRDLADLTSVLVSGLRDVIKERRPELVLVQGDTTTAFAAALAAFYLRVRVGHVEAGLRTHDRFAPFPEEVNRRLIASLADLHFAPTDTARRWLEREGITEGVFVTGNTVTDALLSARRTIDAGLSLEFAREFDFLSPNRRLVLVTGHRRESFGEPFENVCRAIRQLAERHAHVEFVYPVHLNPNVRAPVERILSGVERVHLCSPVDYPRLVWLLSRAYLTLTDSGGIQEEAPTLGVPVLVMRDVTERPEGIEAGCARLVGTDTARIVGAVEELLLDASLHQRMAQVRNPYGDGQAARRIVEIITRS